MYSVGLAHTAPAQAARSRNINMAVVRISVFIVGQRQRGRVLVVRMGSMRNDSKIDFCYLYSNENQRAAQKMVLLVNKYAEGVMIYEVHMGSLRT